MRRARRLDLSDALGYRGYPYSPTVSEPAVAVMTRHAKPLHVLSSVGVALPSGPESLFVSALFLVIVAAGLWFWGSVLLRWVYALRRVPKEFERGRTNTRNATDEDRNE